MKKKKKKEGKGQKLFQCLNHFTHIFQMDLDTEYETGKKKRTPSLEAEEKRPVTNKTSIL